MQEQVNNAQKRLLKSVDLPHRMNLFDYFNEESKKTIYAQTKQEGTMSQYEMHVIDIATKIAKTISYLH